MAAFFDLDGTLLSANSARLWLQRERRHGRVSLWQTFKAVGFLGAYHVGAVDIEHATREALRTIKGELEENVRTWTREWFETEVVPRHEARGGRAVVEAHRSRGHPVVLLTSTSPYESDLAARYFGLDAFLSSRYEVVEGRFTGEPVLPLCYGAGKVELAEAFAAREGIELDRSYFYSDSNTDLPMLLRVGRPRVVNPDARLRWVARRRRWRIVDWSRAGGPVNLDDDP
ncbi:MAG: HAD family hydrolase [Deltaproteobacteria bacterium]|nr:HAD family hydrolase [Deltaproteobacteria bacterium]